MRVLAPQTVEAMTARHRIGLFDETYNVPCDWGLGFQVDAYAMGGYSSPRSFGHGGALSSFTFADPEHALVVAVQTNGMCGNDDHYTAPVRGDGRGLCGPRDRRRRRAAAGEADAAGVVRGGTGHPLKQGTVRADVPIAASSPS